MRTISVGISDQDGSLPLTRGSGGGCSGSLS
jgi:hypothetical protein